jgi:hypothetical protein
MVTRLQGTFRAGALLLALTVSVATCHTQPGPSGKPSKRPGPTSGGSTAPIHGPGGSLSGQPAQADISLLPEVIPNDPNYAADQWYLQPNTPANPGGINMPKAWGFTTGDKSQLIVVSDVDIDLSGADLAADCPERFLEIQRDPGTPIKVGHGTEVISFLGRCSNNHKEMTGVNWRAKILPVAYPERSDPLERLRTQFGLLGGYNPESLDPTGEAKTIGVITYSIGFEAQNLVELFAATKLFEDLAEANARGLIVVSSSGNDSKKVSLKIPAVLPGVITVGATTRAGRAGSFSNWGANVSIMAPGQELLWRTGQPASHGTSFSAPIIAGVISLMKTLQPTLTWKQVQHILKATAKRMSCDDYCTYDPSFPKSTPGTRLSCQADCCKNGLGTAQNSCTAGLVDAARAMLYTSKGIPEGPLVDSNRYYVRLSPDDYSKAISEAIWVKNVGSKKRGSFSVEIETPSRIEVSPSVFELDAGKEQLLHIRYNGKDPTNEGSFVSYIKVKSSGLEPGTKYIDGDPVSDDITIWIGVAEP